MHFAHTKTRRWEDTETRMVKASVRGQPSWGDLGWFREVAEVAWQPSDLLAGPICWVFVISISWCPWVANANVSPRICTRKVAIADDRGPQHPPESKCCCTHEFQWISYGYIGYVINCVSQIRKLGVHLHLRRKFTYEPSPESHRKRPLLLPGVASGLM